MKESAKKNQLILISLLLAAITCAVYVRTLTFDFISVYDDRSYILMNPVVQSGLSVDNVIWAFKSTTVYNWHPLTWMSHMLDCQLYGPKAGGHHATSMILHVGAVILLFLALNRMTKSVWRSAFVAALFGVHPLHIESVAWIAERKDVLSGFFWMLTMWTYALYVERPSIKRYCFVALSFACGLMSKPMLVSLPIVLLLLDYWPLGRFQVREAKPKKNKRNAGISWKLLCWEKLPLLLMAVGSSIATFVAQQSGGAMQSTDDFPPGVRIANALVTYIAYIAKTVWPSKLAVMYPHPGTNLPTWVVLGATALLIAVTALAIRFGRRCPYLPVGWLWYLGTLVPVIGLIQVGKQAMANRYTYIPIIGLFVMVAWGIPELFKKSGEKQEGGKKDSGSPAPSVSHSPVLAILACLIVAAMTVASAIQIRHWRDSISLFEYTVRVTKNNPFSQGNLGWAYMEKDNYPQAIKHFRATSKMMPDAGEIRYGLGACYLAIGDARNAVTEFSAALRIQPNLEIARQALGNAMQRLGQSAGGGKNDLPKSGSPDVDHYNRAVQADQMGDTPLAISEYRQAIRLRPSFAEAHCNLGILLKNQDKLDEAIEQYHEALKDNPGLAEVYVNLAVALYMKGDYAQAWKELRQAREYGITPDPDFVQALSQKMREPSE